MDRTWRLIPLDFIFRPALVRYGNWIRSQARCSIAGCTPFRGSRYAKKPTLKIDGDARLHFAVVLVVQLNISPNVLPYWGAQLLGAAITAWIVGFALKGAAVSIAPVLGAFLAEFLFTFALVYVVLNVAAVDATKGNSYFGPAIGFTVLAGAFAVGQVSGAAFNPAVAIGASIRGMLPWPNLWLGR